MTTPPLDLPALRGWVESGIRVAVEHALEVIARAEAAEKKVAAVRALAERWANEMDPHAVTLRDELDGTL